MAFKKLPYKNALVMNVNGNLQDVTNLIDNFAIGIFEIADVNDEDFKNVQRNFGLTLELRKFLIEKNVDVIVVNSISDFTQFEQLYSFVHLFTLLKFNIVFAKERIDTGKKQNLFEVLKYVQTSISRAG
ncbi:hypothetical protein RRV45_01180 [Bacillus sp. DTU_2020_1000418_1_SI_GHA_SEK_038]|uniref:hypothetical protein n=1 Tax=Bacillus sp. DTU_2020_1000418_1_SI_GHA_SEK_038 TaxID=3077585 RepID=UPI0028EBDF6E|nr:hypothetical protein [Bacillus sp. DTU_2020_1000418_1_SI_GHA_SEK_038]WNS75692.1 hypothetical protein RRV45_01180 [Bacillus sp. DTU_2020_1000418_1_SI_GHA_SEK_038]